jgi:tetratricopeptide (TPR) repeat protein
MAIDEQIERVRDWARSGADLFDPDAAVESEALWRSLRSIHPEEAPMALRRQLHSGYSTLGLFHHLRYQSGHDPVDLAKAVVCFDADDHSMVTPLEGLVGEFADPHEQGRLGALLLEAWPVSHENALLDASILLLRCSGAGMADLCLAYRWRYERTGSAGDLDRAIETGEKAAAVEPGPQAWLNLAEAYELRHSASPDPLAVRRRIELLDRVVRVDNEAHHKLAAAYLALHEQTGDADALDKAVRHAEQGSDPTELGAALFRRFQCRGSLPDLERAAALIDEDELGQANLVGAVSILLARYEYGGDRSNLDRAVRLGDQVLAALPDNQTRRDAVLRVISQALHRRYLSTGSKADLERATTLARWAFSARSPEFAKGAANLAEVLLGRYARSGVLAELDEAVRLAEDLVVDGCPAEYRAILARARHARHMVTRTPQDLADAIELGERAVSETLAHEIALPGRQVDLAAAFRTRHAEFADPSDLDRAAHLAGQAVRDTLDTHVDMPRRLSVLAATHLDRYRARLDLADLETATRLGERAWRHATTLADQRRRLRLAAAFADALFVQVDGGGDIAPVTLADLIEDVTGSPSAEPADQVAGQHAIGRLALAAQRPDLAVPILDAAVALLPALSPRESGWTDRQLRVSDPSGLVEAAVSAHCAIGDPAGAVVTAELGRGVLLAAEANTRVDLAELRERRPRLADRFEWVCERLNAPDFPVEERKRWWADYDTRLEEIRVVPGFEDFLAAPTVEDLRPRAGTTVLLNADRHGGHAVLLGSKGAPRQVDLPDLVNVEGQVGELVDAMADEDLQRRLRRSRVVTEVLGWLWDAVVEPVVQALPAAAGPHRVWWVPTGALGLLPLHAAGRPDRPGALDLLVSSFMPSSRALADILRRRPAQSRRQLVVTVQTTQGKDDLREAAAEGAMLGGTQLQDAGAVADSVLTALTESNWAHFACHAVADPVEPAAGGLQLSDGTLTLPEIGGLRLKDAELAYLSACSTANHGVRHANEVLHLASAFQLAGFRHVVATLWPLKDHIAAKAASAFYRRLPNGPQAGDAAQVLRGVTLDLRATYSDRPDLWATLVHSGP